MGRSNAEQFERKPLGIAGVVALVVALVVASTMMVHG
jgi:hypothetical protein